MRKRHREREKNNNECTWTFNPELQYMHARLGRGHHKVLNGDQIIKWPLRKIKIMWFGWVAFLSFFFLLKSPGELAELALWILHSVPASTRGAGVSMMVCCILRGRDSRSRWKSPTSNGLFHATASYKTVKHPEYNCLWCWSLTLDAFSHKWYLSYMSQCVRGSVCVCVHSHPCRHTCMRTLAK